ncbi:unnamed protein product [Adineta steineri]|uniref:Glycylpeptide N-tetradecanoyltransferase n=1 Tax=Adineta steineri TaxID=433720 RepID=A0A815GIM4_9BILA|nr:unnamed protein product [Adineta steineri]CAF1339334.1 unnamed protein product [Adineta steineri]CAF1348169.1 unnamed protein product [Adineta steineri]
MRNLMKQTTLIEQAAVHNNNENTPKYDEKSASKQEWKFWQTQPVPTIGTKIDTINIGPIESNKSVDEIRQEPYELPNGFFWDDIDIHVDEQLQELCTFLDEHYIEDDGNNFRLKSSMPFLRWALCVPDWLKKFHVGVRVTKSSKLVGFISAVPIRIRVYDKELSMVDINFLCVHKKLRLKRLSPVLIKEITRRGHLEKYFQAVYTAAPFLPGLACKARYWHRLLNVKKLLAIKFAFLGRNMTMQRMQKLYRLPETTQVAGFREMRDADIPQASKILTQYLTKFDLAPVFSLDEFEYLCKNRSSIVSAFVVENDQGEITDFISYYHLPSTIINHPEYKTLNACYMYYYAASRTPLTDLVNDCLIQAHNSSFDVFNALDIMNNKEFLKKLKFGDGDGNLQYYVYNWKCPLMPPENMSFFKKKSATNEDIASGGGDSSMFGLTRDQTKELMELLDKTKELDSNNQQDLQQRHIAYGKNHIPRKPISYLPFTSEWKTEHEFRHPLLLGDVLSADDLIVEVNDLAVDASSITNLTFSV